MARGRCYALLAHLLAGPIEKDLLEKLRAMKGDDATPMGGAIALLAKAARATEIEMARAEYETLFIGVGESELNPYASVYLTGFLNEKPLADLRADLRALGLAAPDSRTEPEDHIALLCDVMSGLIRGDFGQAAPLAEQRKFFEAHLASWADRFFAELEGSKNAVFYAPVGTFGRLFIELEREAFELAE